MRLLKSWIVAVVAVVASLSLTEAYAAEEAHFKTPEEAVTGFLDAVKKQDFEAILATTAVDRMSEGYDFVAQAGQLKVIMPSFAMPANDPFFISVNKAFYAGMMAKDVQFLTYSLMLANNPVIIDTLLEGHSYANPDYPTAAWDMFDAVQAERLSELSISKIGTPLPEEVNSERQQRLFSGHAKLFQGDAETERVALLSFDGRDFLVGFSLIRFGDDWLVEGTRPWVAKTNRMGGAKRTTPDEFEALIR
ncbi:hypothetical protein [Pleomorphomonas sp. NRK KF1]|uniref:hypothetical protein n=1 Tax=Pleomorphomonas sp. NRK KF1 TaxID=2943000 RepID=UPI002044A3AD|nr:hypothetical protein [Pleomorphomonas sp. NRK KF1]MCM5554056.1 hypothetical protein [Pleomorphomonas sp. NRK KF1]